MASGLAPRTAEGLAAAPAAADCDAAGTAAGARKTTAGPCSGRGVGREGGIGAELRGGSGRSVDIAGSVSVSACSPAARALHSRMGILTRVKNRLIGKKPVSGIGPLFARSYEEDWNELVEQVDNYTQKTGAAVVQTWEVGAAELGRALHGRPQHLYD